MRCMWCSITRATNDDADDLAVKQYRTTAHALKSASIQNEDIIATGNGPI